MTINMRNFNNTVSQLVLKLFSWKSIFTTYLVCSVDFGPIINEEPYNLRVATSSCPRQTGDMMLETDKEAIEMWYGRWHLWP